MQRNARAWLGLDDHHNDALVNQDGYASEDVGEIQDDDETPSGQFAVGNGIQIAIVRPRNFRDAATIGEYYRQEIPVIINLEDMSNAEAWRIIDFASGLILGLCGDIERLSRRTFLIVPADTTILTAHDGLTEEGFFNQALRRIFAEVYRILVGRTAASRAPSDENSVYLPATPAGTQDQLTVRGGRVDSLSSPGSRRNPPGQGIGSYPAARRCCAICSA